jgi:predicted RNA-binding Zn-ribbon protein involved in translation (DUF1610 family)
VSAAQLSPHLTVFRSCSNCSGTMTLRGHISPQGSFEYYACPDCGDALDARLVEEATHAQ